MNGVVAPVDATTAAAAPAPAPGGAPTGDEGAGVGVSSSTSVGNSSESEEEKAAREAGLAAARAQKDKLLAYSRSDSSSRSSIIDDQADYYEFESNVWLSQAAAQQKKQQAEAEMKRLHTRAAHRITLDLVNRSVKAEDSDPFRVTREQAEREATEAGTGPVFKFQGEVKKEEEQKKRGAKGGAAAAAAAAKADSAAVARVAAIRDSAANAGASMRAEMQIVSKAQYYRNDTLTGRAKAVYDALKQAIHKPQPTPSSSSSSSSSSVSARAALANSSSSSSSSSSFPTVSASTAAALSRLQHADASEFALLTCDEAEMGVDWEEEKERERDRKKEWEKRVKEREKAYDQDEPDCRGPQLEDLPSCGSSSSSSSSSSPSSSSSSSSCSSSLYPDSTDVGMTLSLTQPWASLLVLGIKRFEGRGWSTPYRGRLWIASTAQEPDPDTIAAVEAEYETVYSGLQVPFPSSYPKAALLGCVDLVDCISNDEFQSLRLTYLQSHRYVEDSESRFIFCCTNPRVLTLPQRISGQHKLWTLPQKVKQVVQAGVRKVDERWRTEAERGRQRGGAGGGKDNDKGNTDTGSSSSSSSGSSSASGAGDKSAASDLRFTTLIRRERVDLWPSNTTRALLSSSSSSSSSKSSSSSSSPSLLTPGVVLFRSFLSLQEQQQLIDMIRSLGLKKEEAGFYVPLFPAAGSNSSGEGEMNLKMMCLGQRWNHVEHVYETSASVPPIPAHFLSLVSSIYQALSSSSSSLFSSSQLVSPDVCLVNYYPPSKGRLGVHRDVDESEESIQQGCVVVSVSLGDTAEFVWSANKPAETSGNMGGGGGGGGSGISSAGLNLIKLNSGDVLVFGGASRLIYHGVERVLPNTAPRELFMRPGRINLTFRKI